MESIATETVFANVPALNGETCFQVYFFMKSFFTEVYGMSMESEGSTMLLQYIKDRGAPLHLHNNNSKIQTSKVWSDICNQYLIQTSTTEPHQPQQNPCERRIQTIKSRSNAVIDSSGAPPSTWFYCTCYVVDLLNHTAHPKLDWRTPFEKAFGITPDILPYFHFHFWDSVYYFENVTFPQSNEKIGYWLGVTQNCGDALIYYIYVPETYQVIARSDVCSVSESLEDRPNLRAACSQEFHE